MKGKPPSTGATDKAHTWRRRLNSWKRIDSLNVQVQPSKCPQCGSQRAWRDGFYYPRSNGVPVQRWLCRDCYCRFTISESSEDVQKVHRQTLNCNLDKPSTRQVGVSQTKAMINLATIESRIQEQAAGATTPNQTITALILDFAWQAKKRGLAESTIQQRVQRLRLLVKRGAKLTDPDSVLTVLATNNWTDINKRVFIVAYQSFAKMFKIPWESPKTRVERKLPFIPTEAEIDQLIAGMGKKTATFLQVLKDTGARSAEARKLRWIDVDARSCTIMINNPVKGSMARVVKVTPKTIAMINNLPKDSDFLFNTNTYTLRNNFCKQRNRLAKILQNPKLRQIHFHTLRHWKATMEYHRTKDILHVKQLLGHKKLENTEIYTHLINFESDEWHVAHAKTLEEETKLLEAGFEYVRYSDRDGVAIYRKRK